jgi:hypothetical protein
LNFNFGSGITTKRNIQMSLNLLLLFCLCFYCLDEGKNGYYSVSQTTFLECPLLFRGSRVFSVIELSYMVYSPLSYFVRSHTACTLASQTIR